MIYGLPPTLWCISLGVLLKEQPEQPLAASFKMGSLPASTLRAKLSSDGVYAWGPRLARLCLATPVSKMRVRTVGNQGLILRGTFREHFTFHSWQAEMGCQTAF